MLNAIAEFCACCFVYLDHSCATSSKLQDQLVLSLSLLSTRMAGSRLHNFGTIFSRVTGLLETGAIKEVPIWYDVYKKYPPELEPRSDRPEPPQPPIPEIVYEEDFARAKESNPRYFALEKELMESEEKQKQ